MLVAVMLNTLFARQIPQIGIMKAVGATTGRIAGLATATTLVVAATATALALGPAVLLGRSAVGLFLGFLGVRPAELGAPWWTYALVVALGLGLPPLMALRPLLRTARTTVRAAIDHSGAPPSPATGLVTRLGRLRLDRGLLMAVRNTVRRPARFALSTGLLAVAGTVFMAGMSLSTSVEAVTEERVAETTWDVDVQLADPVPADRVATALAGVPGVTAVDQLGVFPTAVAVDDDVPITRTYPDQGHGRVSLTAIPAGATTVAPPDLLEGRWLDPGETGAVVLNQVTRENSVPDVRTGQTVTLVLGGRTTAWRVVGVVEEVGHGAAVYTTTEGLTAAGRPALVTTLRATTAAHDESSRDAAATAIRDALAAAGIEVRAAASVSRGEAISAGTSARSSSSCSASRCRSAWSASSGSPPR
ncbi:FtsX-like permease family protein [Actinokineospora soli]|uniref:FtsX-like permease family protein n=1 Tax=Actinokineospora soli TaxID=1048753 RepID=A0ABW2TKQ3_9PSEU